MILLVHATDIVAGASLHVGAAGGSAPTGVRVALRPIRLSRNKQPATFSSTKPREHAFALTQAVLLSGKQAAESRTATRLRINSSNSAGANNASGPRGAVSVNGDW